MFPSQRNEYPWSNDRPFVPDSRVPAKNNDEYHGYQTYAGQYASQAMYGEAARFFQMSADLRAEQMRVLPQLVDPGHMKAVEVNQQLSRYYLALERWQDNGGIRSELPQPSAYNLSNDMVAKIESSGAQKFAKR